MQRIAARVPNGLDRKAGGGEPVVDGGYRG
jgi:hypothetical protein